MRLIDDGTGETLLLKNQMPPLETLVNDAMNHSVDNGYRFEGWTYQQIAEDIVTFDSDLEVFDPVEIEPILRKWFAQSGLTYRPYHN